MIATILVGFHILLACVLVGLVLLQHGRGADAGAAFGSGASATVFGARGARSFLSTSTAVVATLFFMTSMGLAYLSRGRAPEPQSVIERSEAIEKTTPAPVAGDVPASGAAESAPAQAPEEGTGTP